MTVDTGVVSPLCAGDGEELRLVYLLEPRAVALNGLRAGRNTLAIEGENRPAPVTRNPAGLLCRLEIRFTDGAMLRVDSDDAWRASKTVMDGWQRTDFDARDWVAPKLAGCLWLCAVGRDDR